MERFLKDALKDLPDCDDEIVKNLEKLFDSPDEGCQRTAAEGRLVLFDYVSLFLYHIF